MQHEIYRISTRPVSYFSYIPPLLYRVGAIWLLMHLNAARAGTNTWLLAVLFEFFHLLTVLSSSCNRPLYQSFFYPICFSYTFEI